MVQAEPHRRKRAARAVDETRTMLERTDGTEADAEGGNCGERGGPDEIEQDAAHRRSAKKICWRKV